MNYDKPLSKEDMAAMIHLQINHPRLLNPEYFEMDEEPDEVDEDDEFSWADWNLDMKIDRMREEAI